MSTGKRSEKPLESIVFHSGDIVTMSDTTIGPVEAILVENGKIVSVGTNDKVFKHINNATRIIDLKGNTLMPGFIGVHMHPDLVAYLYRFVDLSGFTHGTTAEVWDTLRQAVQKSEPGQWIFCKGFDPVLIPGLEAPDITFLDSIAPDNPVLIVIQSLHSAWANSRAFEKMGISASSPNPATGSYFEKNGQGKLTGRFVGNPAIMTGITHAFKIFDIKNDVPESYNEYLSNGITSITTMGLLNDNLLTLFEYLSTDHTTPTHKALQLKGMLPDRKPTVRHFMYIRHTMPDLFPDNVDNGDDFFRICGLKILYDGSPYAGSMYVKEPYQISDLTTKGLHIPPGSTGSSASDKQEFYNIFKKYHDLGWQVSVHCQGDKAAEDVLNMFEDIRSKSPVKDTRDRLEHCVLLPQALLTKVKKLGMTPSFHINHIYYYGNALKNDILGKERAETMLPLNSALKNGLQISLHADAPMYPEVPLSLLQTAVTRQTRQGEIIGASEAIPVMEGLKALTIYPAWQLHMDKKIGSIEPGKYADLIVLDKNPLKVATESLRDIRVLSTFVNGKEVWKY